MGIPAVGSVVLINFPYADLRRPKKRPAVVIAHGSLDTVILCQITSQSHGVPMVRVEPTDYAQAGLSIASYVRPDKLLTVDAELAGKQQLGIISNLKIKEVKSAVREALR